ncbi:hypothetical protein [Rugamonas apoptosis]|uniref:Uncharacterized protein n=1 Tax=Rugamonas apoptosis TaxID=2758570 RepID=A0A7W2FF85_9BURK|nr:hypothetical protein [Rugamonas apoptosis]MBA5690537.1 hypothetical protein [Rugamonas apoptosis]
MSAHANADGPTIELSTVHFFHGPAPRVVSLKGCSLPMCEAMPGLMCGFYGRQAKQDGFMAAYAYAQLNNLDFTVIDFHVRLTSPINPVKMSIDEVGSHDLVSLAQARRELWKTIDFLIKDDTDDDAGGANLETDGKLLLLDRPGLISRVTDNMAFQHVKVMAFDSRTFISPRTLTVGVVPFRHWDAITHATCRLNPTTQVLLDSPIRQEKPRPPALAPAPAPRSRA